MTRTLSWWALALLSLAVAVFSYRVAFPHPFVSPDVAANLAARPWLPIHAALASTALLLGPFQFVTRLRVRRPALHRTLGQVYVAACLLGGVAGLLLAWGTTAGPVGQAGFGLLAIVWIATTAYAWRLAVARRFVEHRRWMVRSFALTFAAVTLRLYLPIAPMMGWDFMVAYRAISFLCWVPNLIVAELYLMGGRRSS
ncbi:MAG: DUF2306 domain-containing protein [Phenylobacterium sp.]